MSAGYDAQLQNSTDRDVRQFTDLDLFFGKKTSDSDISKVTDVQAVKRSIRNLVQLNVYDKPENMTPVVSAIIARQVQDVIENFEPRARLDSVRAIPDFDRNAYEIQVSFYVVNTPTELVDLTIMLERLR